MLRVYVVHLDDFEHWDRDQKIGGDGVGCCDLSNSNGNSNNNSSSCCSTGSISISGRLIFSRLK